MRNFRLLLVFVSGCSLDAFRYDCNSSVQCGTNGICIDGACAYPSSSCSSGYQFDSSATGGRAGMCSEAPDLSIGNDNDGGRDAAVDQGGALGTACSLGVQCTGGLCVDGLCCDRKCDQQCEACDQTPGMCTTIMGTPHGSRNPCAGSGICGGTCAGQTTCEYPDSSTPCGAQTCSPSPSPTVTFGSQCDAKGACVPIGGMATAPCSPPPHASPLCAGNGTCDFVCDTDFAKMGTACKPVWVAQNSSQVNILFLAVWASSATDIYVGGTSGVIIHSTGDGNWSSPQTGPSSLNNLNDIRGRDATHLFAVSTYGTIFVSAGDGTWTAQSLSGSDMSTLSGIWPTTGTQTFAGGQAGKIWVNYGNASWDLYQLALTSGPVVRKFWGSSTTDVYAAANGGVYHAIGSGGQFAKESTAPNYNYTQVWGSSPGDVYAVAAGGVIIHGKGGNQWSLQSSGTSEDLNGIWGADADHIWAVGGGTTAATILFSPGDGTWTPQIVPSAVTGERLMAVWGSSADDVYVVGSHGTILHLK